MSFYTNPQTQTVFTNSSQTANFTAVANYIYLVNATSAGVTVTLPTSTSNQTIFIKKTDSSTNAVTLSGTINGTGSSTLAITKQNQIKELYYDGSGGWNVIAGDIDTTTVGSSASTAGYIMVIGAANMTVGLTAPTSPATGDLWIDTN